MRDGELLDTLIRGGNVVLPDGVHTADIGIQGGIIVALGPGLTLAARETIDASDSFVMAGVVDAHVHLNEPGMGYWEGFATGSAALAAGGCTTYFDMPLNGLPPTVTPSALQRKLDAANASGSRVDYGLWGGLVPGNLDELDGLADAGVIGFKAFMSDPGDTGEGSFKEVDDVELFEGMTRIARRNKVLAVHAESEEIIAALSRRVRGRGGKTARDYLDTRPIAAELDALRRVLLFAERTECPLHIVRVSSPQAADLIWEARMGGVDVTTETCPHYLVFTDDEIERLGPLGKCAPPFRGAREREGLWERLAEGKIDMIASDHSPCPPEMKLGAMSDYFAIRGGIAGAQSTLQLIIDEGHTKRGIPLHVLSKALSETPAKRFGLFPRKGRIAIGADADLALVHPDSPNVLTAEKLLYRHKISVYEGRAFRSDIVMTMSRGRIVYTREGGIVGRAEGEWLRVPPETQRRRLAF
ncbi:allantoinase AllB [Cohnella sp. GCM10027633]|uniref:allantoinase AllB n=1 Tax=unclassified Cohnella TaxID=2636738 RepID=UPI00363A57B1